MIVWLYVCLCVCVPVCVPVCVRSTLHPVMMDLIERESSLDPEKTTDEEKKLGFTRDPKRALLYRMQVLCCADAETCPSVFGKCRCVAPDKNNKIDNNTDNTS